MSPYTERLRAILTRYLEGQQSLDSAVADFAAVCKELRRRAHEVGRPTTLAELLVDRPDMDVLRAGDGLLSGLTGEQVPRIQKLLKLAFHKLADDDKGAA